MEQGKRAENVYLKGKFSCLVTGILFLAIIKYPQIANRQPLILRLGVY